MIPVPHAFLLVALSLSVFKIESLAQAADGSKEYEAGVILYDLNQEDKDFTEAEKYFLRSAAKGFTPARYMLGRIYQEGNANFKNLEKSYLWYKRAAEDLLGEENEDSANGVPPGAFSLDFDSEGNASTNNSVSKQKTDQNTGSSSKPKPIIISLDGSGPVDQPPVPVRQPSPIAPTKLAGIKGDVTALYKVSAKGRVSDIEILEQTHDEYGKAVEDVLPKWTFKPAKRGEKAVRVGVKQLFEFNKNSD